MHQETLSLKTTSKGSRVWLNNGTLKNSGFTAGVRYKVEFFKRYVLVSLDENGARTVSKGDIIDLQNKSMTKIFPNSNRVHVLYGKGKVIIKAYHHDEKIKRREVSLIERIARKLPLRLGDWCAGIGFLGKQFAKGLLAAGIMTSVVFANEYDRHACDIYHNSNTEHMESFADNVVIIHDDLFTMDQSLVPELDVMVVGYPCVGFSGQQSSNRSRDVKHLSSGLLFVPLLESINRANPSLIMIENSDRMLDSETSFIMDTVLEKTGYKYSHTVLDGLEHGDFEPRRRLAKVYYSKNLSDLDLTQLKVKKTNPRTLADLLEPMSLSSSNWKDLSYLSKKNKDKSHNHKFIVPKPSATKLPTFTASYAKIQCDSTIIEHPENPKLHRICTASEHCNVRHITGELKKGVVSIAEGTHHLQKGRTNATKAHFLLGNTISPTPWVDLGRFVGEWVLGQSSIHPEAS